MQKLIGKYQDGEAVFLEEVLPEKRPDVKKRIRASIDTRDWMLWWEDARGLKRFVLFGE